MRERCALHARYSALSAARFCAAVEVTCQVPGCDKDTRYHSACVRELLAKCGAAGWGKFKNNACGVAQGKVTTLRLNGARRRAALRMAR